MADSVDEIIAAGRARTARVAAISCAVGDLSDRALDIVVDIARALGKLPEEDLQLVRSYSKALAEWHDP